MTASAAVRLVSSVVVPSAPFVPAPSPTAAPSAVAAIVVPGVVSHRTRITPTVPSPWLSPATRAVSRSSGVDHAAVTGRCSFELMTAATLVPGVPKPSPFLYETADFSPQIVTDNSPGPEAVPVSVIPRSAAAAPVPLVAAYGMHQRF